MSKIRKTSKASTREPKFGIFRAKALDLMQKYEVRHLFKYKVKFKDFWKDYCKTFDFPLDEIMKANKMPKKPQNYLLRIKCEKANNKGLGEVKEINNSIVVSYQTERKIKAKKRKQITTDREIDIVDTETTDTIKEFRRERKKIVEINFASEITRSTVSRINEACKFKELFTKDYLYFLQGGTDQYETLKNGKKRKRFNQQLTHIDLANKLRDEINELTRDLLSDVDNESKHRLVNRKLATFDKLLKGARDIDLQPIEFLGKLADDDFSTQKALNGAIINDHTMINNGQLIVEGEKKVEQLTPENLKEDLNNLGNAIFDQQLRIVDEGGKYSNDTSNFSVGLTTEQIPKNPDEGLIEHNS